MSSRRALAPVQFSLATTAIGASASIAVMIVAILSFFAALGRLAWAIWGVLTTEIDL